MGRQLVKLTHEGVSEGVNGRLVPAAIVVKYDMK